MASRIVALYAPYISQREILSTIFSSKGEENQEIDVFLIYLPLSIDLETLMKECRLRNPDALEAFKIEIQKCYILVFSNHARPNPCKKKKCLEFAESMFLWSTSFYYRLPLLLPAQIEKLSSLTLSTLDFSAEFIHDALNALQETQTKASQFYALFDKITWLDKNPRVHMLRQRLLTSSENFECSQL